MTRSSRDQHFRCLSAVDLTRDHFFLSSRAMFANWNTKKNDMESPGSTAQQRSELAIDPSTDVTADSQPNRPTIPLKSPHDVVISRIESEVRELEEAGGAKGSTSPKLRNRELPENVYDPFDGQSVGVMVPGEFEEEEDDLWTHLAEIRNLQSDVARLHAQMERLGENDRFYVPEEVGEEETVNAEDEGKAAKAAEFAKLSDRFSVRKEAIDAIMQKVSDFRRNILLVAKF